MARSAAIFRYDGNDVRPTVVQPSPLAHGVQRAPPVQAVMPPHNAQLPGRSWLVGTLG